MRVLHIGLETVESRPGGLNRYFEGLVAAQRAAGIDAVGVALGTYGGPQDPRDISAGPIGGSPLARALEMVRAPRGVADVDVVDAHFAGTAAAAMCTSSVRRAPLVVHFQGPWAEESALRGASWLNQAAKRRLERVVYRRASRFVVLSSSFGAILRRRYGVAPWSIDVVAPGVDVDRFTPGDRDAARSSLGLPSGRVVLCVRRLVPRMGVDVLLDAWAALAPTDADRLVIAGDGPLRADLEARAGELGIAGTVRFVGRIDDAELVDAYRAADLTVVPSVALEGFGLVVLESLACGTPVIGTDVDGLAEALALTGQRGGVRAGDGAALSAAMREVLAEPVGADVRAACRARAEGFAWPIVARRHAAIYAAVQARAEPVRVVVLDHTAVLSGGELALARALEGVRDDAAVHVILGADGPLRARLEAAGATVEVRALGDSARTVARDEVTVARLGPGAAVATARYVVSLARRLRELRPDVVHTNSLKAAVYGGAAARLAGVPCVWHIRDRIEVPYLPAGATTLVRTLARVLPTLVVANSPSTLATIGVEGRVLASPLDPSISPTPTSQTTSPRFVVVGRLAPWKGQRLALEAFAEAFPDGDATLQIAGAPLFGEASYAASLPELAHQLGIAERVEFCGFVDDIATLLADADVVVHASVLAEPFGQTVLEGMGAGRPVLVADAGGAAELVTDGVEGLHYAMGDRAALAASMRRLAMDPALRASLGTAGAMTAAAYTPKALAPTLLGVWRDVSRRTLGDDDG